MSLRPGQPAPDFECRSDDGRNVNLTDYRGHYLVLFFYSRAGAPTCSIQAEQFQAALPEFERLNASVVGVSTDTEARQANFRDSCHLTYPMIPDGDRRLSRTYGVLRGLTGLMGTANRVTFLINPHGQLVYRHRSTDPASHITSVLRELERLQGA